MDLPILAGIEEAEYVWIPICFKGLKAFSCRQGRGVLNTPSERPSMGRMTSLEMHLTPSMRRTTRPKTPRTAPYGSVGRAYSIRPYSLPAGGAFSYGQWGRIGIRFQNEYPQKMEIPLPRPGKLAGYGMNPKRDGDLEGVAEG